MAIFEQCRQPTWYAAVLNLPYFFHFYAGHLPQESLGIWKRNPHPWALLHVCLQIHALLSPDKVSSSAPSISTTHTFSPMQLQFLAISWQPYCSQSVWKEGWWRWGEKRLMEVKICYFTSLQLQHGRHELETNKEDCSALHILANDVSQHPIPLFIFSCQPGNLPSSSWIAGNE